MEAILDDAAFEVVSCGDKAAWLKGRELAGIGSSDVPAMLGISRWKSPYVLFYEKLGVQPPNRGDQTARDMGLLLEGPIAELYEAETHRAVHRPPQWSYAVSKAHPYMTASVDRFVMTPGDVKQPPAEGAGVLEIKNAHLYMGSFWSEEPPLEYLVQLQHQLAVTGLAWGSIGALIGGCRFVWQDIPRDNELIGKLVELEGQFWERLLRKDPPEVDGHETTTALLKQLYPHDTGEIKELPPEAFDVHNELQEAKAKLKTIKTQVDAAENKLRAWIGDATAGALPNGVTYTYKVQKRAGYEVQPTEFRVLRLAGGKGR